MDNKENKELPKEKTEEKVDVVIYQHRCGYCGSAAPLISQEEIYGPGVVGYDCCPDCGGV